MRRFVVSALTLVVAALFVHRVGAESPSGAASQTETTTLPAACRAEGISCIITEAVAILKTLDAQADAQMAKDLTLQILALISPDQRQTVLSHLPSSPDPAVDMTFEFQRATILGPDAVTAFFKSSGRQFFETATTKALIDSTNYAIDQGSKDAVSKLLPGLLVRSVGESPFQERLAFQAMAMAAYHFLGDDTRAGAQLDRMMTLFDEQAVQGQDEGITNAIVFWLAKTGKPEFIAPFVQRAKAKGLWTPSTAFHGCALALSGETQTAQSVMEKQVLGLILDIGKQDTTSKPGRIASLYRIVWMFKTCGPGIGFDRIGGMIAKATALYAKQAEAETIPALRFALQVAMHVPDHDPDLIQTSAALALTALRQDAQPPEDAMLARSVMISVLMQRTMTH